MCGLLLVLSMRAMYITALVFLALASSVRVSVLFRGEGGG
jgi:hypothetical protein